MRVKLIEYTPEPERVIALAGRLCYTDSDIEALSEKMTDEKVLEFINKLNTMGHLSPFEHVSFTFCVEGISRVTTHQLVRHRLASYSQQSQRYVKMSEPKYIIPPEIESNDIAKGMFIEHCERAHALYFALQERGVKKEDARYVLPEASETKIMVTMNARELMHFFTVRCCNRAQWEIRGVANRMLELSKEVAPILFEKSGPSCRRGVCPEGDYSCKKVEGK